MVKSKRCVSPCQGKVLDKCKLPFCAYVNKTRKYCTLNRKRYSLINDERGCNIYPNEVEEIKDVKKKKSAAAPVGVSKTVKAKLISKLNQAKARVFTRKVQALRKKHAEKTIKKFMMNPQVREKSTALFLNSICSDSGVCIAFGEEAAKIKKYFNNFTDFAYLHGKLKRIGAPSNNGVLYELEYMRQGYKAYAILKSSLNKNNDNLMYEYFVGNAVNTFGKQFPCFVETYGLFKYPIESDWNKMMTTINLKKEDVVKKKLALLDKPTFAALGTGCSQSKLQCVLIQHLKNVQGLGPLVTKNENNFTDNELMPLLYIIYFALNTLANKFTHYDLHGENVLLYRPHENKYINYVFHESSRDGEAARVVKFKSSFIPKIIDYGRSFYSLDVDNNSKKLYKKLCSLDDCKPDCGETQGFGWLNQTQYHIKSRQKNISHDLRLLRYLRYDIKQPHYKASKEIKQLINKVVYSTEYGTAENHTIGLPDKINNITDAFYALSEMVGSEQPNKSDQLYPVSTYSSYGELHVYADGRPMRFIKA